MVKNQSFKQDKVDVTANSQRLSNPLYTGIKTWRIYTYIQDYKKKAILCAKRHKQKHQQLREFFQ